MTIIVIAILWIAAMALYLRLRYGRRALIAYKYNIGVTFSQAVNAIFLAGDPDESVSGRIGKSHERGGWASWVPWPKPLLNHFLYSVEHDRGHNAARKRESWG